MHRDWPFTQLQNDAAPGKRPGLRACLMLMLGAGILCATALGAQAPKADPGAKPATAQAKDTAPGGLCGQRKPARPATKRWPRGSPTIRTPRWR